MYMAPDTYRKINKEFKNIKKVVTAYLEGRDSDGLIRPMYLQEEIEQLKKEISMEIGMCNIGQNCVTNPNRKAVYQSMVDELNCYLDQLEHLL